MTNTNKINIHRRHEDNIKMFYVSKHCTSELVGQSDSCLVTNKIFYTHIQHQN
jgi:hypothetical protein